MKIVWKIFKGILIIILIPIMYLVVSIILTYITIHPDPVEASEREKTVYLSSNGVHAAIVIHKNNLESGLLRGLYYDTDDEYFSFGWGEENFYLNTPTWNDLTLKNAITAIFTNSPTLIHLTRNKRTQQDWVKIKVTDNQLKLLNGYINETFKTGKDQQKIILKGKGYSSNDNFYKARGNYTAINTCNTWVNTALKKSNLKACLWTPFEFRLMAIYKESD